MTLVMARIMGVIPMYDERRAYRLYKSNVL